MPSKRIDVHAHFLPDFYHDALVETGETSPDGFPEIPKWSEEAALNMMDRLQIEAALLSISSPGVHFGDDQRAKELSRRVNEEGTRLRQAHPPLWLVCRDAFAERGHGYRRSNLRNRSPSC
jgi:6-methylsalicylate decarboxylase